MNGLALNGEKGIIQVLRRLLAETAATLGLNSYRGIGEIRGKKEGVLEKAETSGRWTKS
jgi:hypothetical protein